MLKLKIIVDMLLKSIIFVCNQFKIQIMTVEVKKEKKDYYTLIIDGKEIIKNQERSIFRYIIEKMDNSINTGV